MKEIDPSVVQLWQDTKRAFGDNLKPTPALAFLGVVLAYPFHAWLTKERITFTPGAWLHGRAGTGKTFVGEAALSFYSAPVRLNPSHTTHSIMHALDSAAGTLAVMNEYRTGNDRNMDRLLGLCDNPPLVLSILPASDRSLHSRYLHFAPAASDAPLLASIAHRLPLILDAIRDNHLFVRMVIESVLDDPSSYVTGPGLDGRASTLLTTVLAVFTAIDLTLSNEESEASGELQGWLCRHGGSLFPQPVAA